MVSQKVEYIDHNQNQNRSVEGAVCALEEKDISDAQHQARDGNGAQGQEVNRLGHFSALANREIAQHIGEGRARQSGQKRQLQ